MRKQDTGHRPIGSLPSFRDRGTLSFGQAGRIAPRLGGRWRTVTAWTVWSYEIRVCPRAGQRLGIEGHNGLTPHSSLGVRSPAD